MRPPSSRLFEIFTRLDGSRLHGFLTTTPAPGMASDKTGFRILHVKRPCIVTVGDLIKAHGATILLLDHPDDDFNVVKFKAAYISNSYRWTRRVTTMHPVARVETDFGEEDLGLLHCNFEVPKTVLFDKMVDTSYHFLTGQAIEVGDKVGEKTIKSVTEIFGVKCGYAE